jgi:hypothetical protein
MKMKSHVIALIIVLKAVLNALMRILVIYANLTINLFKMIKLVSIPIVTLIIVKRVLMIWLIQLKTKNVHYVLKAISLIKKLVSVINVV